MSEMFKRECNRAGGNADDHKGQGERLWVYKGVFWVAVFRFAGAALRAVRHGQREDKDKIDHKIYTYMSQLRLSFLNLLQSLGESSGCHQIPERSFKIGWYTFPVCARCTGVFFGQVSAVVLLLLGIICPHYIAFVLIAVMVTDWFVQRIGLLESTNVRRLITGLCGGFGLFSLYIKAFILIYNLIFNI